MGTHISPLLICNYELPNRTNATCIFFESYDMSIELAGHITYNSRLNILICNALNGFIGLIMILHTKLLRA